MMSKYSDFSDCALNDSPIDRTLSLSVSRNAGPLSPSPSSAGLMLPSSINGVAPSTTTSLRQVGKFTDTKASNEKTKDSKLIFPKLWITDDSGGFKVVVRVRPAITSETRKADGTFLECVVVESANKVRIIADGNIDGNSSSGGNMMKQENNLNSFTREGAFLFKFDRVYDRRTSQTELYTSAVSDVVSSVLEGYNGSVIAYGQTSTGKTYTMEGHGDGENAGMISCASKDIFRYLKAQNVGNSTVKSVVHASFIQIYNEQVMDLLSNTTVNLNVREDVVRGVYVDGVSEHHIYASSDILTLLRKGDHSRTTASTNLNRNSSRSHACFTITIEQTLVDDVDGDKTVITGKLNLVDLAGSERVKDSGVIGQRFEEVKKINASLSAFSNVILALTTRQGNAHIPYRDSKLTRILQNSLGGNCKTLLITTVSPALSYFHETLNTLKFAHRAKNVQNVPIINQHKGDDALLARYGSELVRMKRELSSKMVREDMLLAAQKERDRVLLENESLRKRIESLEKELSEKSSSGNDATGISLTKDASVSESSNADLSLQDALRHEMEVEQERIRLEYEEKMSLVKKEQDILARDRQVLCRKETEFFNKNFAIADDVTLDSGQPAVSFFKFQQQQNRNRHVNGDSLKIQRAASQCSMQLENINDNDISCYDQSHLELVYSDSTIDAMQQWEYYVRQLLDNETGIPLVNRLFSGVKHYCFSGTDAVSWFCSHLEGVNSAAAAITVGQQMLNLDIIQHCHGGLKFDANETDYFVFTPRWLKVAPNSVSETDVRRESINPDISVLYEAVSVNDKTTVKKLLPRCGVDARDAHERTALIYAAQSGLVKMCEFLLKNEAFIDAIDENGRTALMWAAHFSFIDVIRVLLKAGAKVSIVDNENRSALHRCLSKNTSSSQKSLSLLLRTVVDTNMVNQTDEEGWSPMHWAVLSGAWESTRALLKAGGNVEIVDSLGKTVLHYAVVNSSVPVKLVKQLCDEHKDLINMKDHSGRTALHLSCSDGSLDSVSMLLAMRFCDIDAVDNVRSTSLHWAAACGRADVVQLLLQKGANSTVCDNQGCNALEYATRKNAVNCMNILSQAQHTNDVRTEKGQENTTKLLSLSRSNAVLQPLPRTPTQERSSIVTISTTDEHQTSKFLSPSPLPPASPRPSSSSSNCSGARSRTRTLLSPHPYNNASSPIPYSASSAIRPVTSSSGSRLSASSSPRPISPMQPSASLRPRPTTASVSGPTRSIESSLSPCATPRPSSQGGSRGTAALSTKPKSFMHRRNTETTMFSCIPPTTELKEQLFAYHEL